MAPRAIKYILLIVDCKTRFAIERPLQIMTADSIISQLQYVKTTYGRLPQKLYTDFDQKLLSRKVQLFCNQNDCNIIATRFELVYNKQQDYRMLFRLFGTCYFPHTKDKQIDCTMAQAQTMQDIAVGYSEIANGMEIYNPITKQLYTDNIFRLDENNQTDSQLNLIYDGGMFLGVLSASSNPPDPFPVSTKINFDGPISNVKIHGVIKSTPSPILQQIISLN